MNIFIYTTIVTAFVPYKNIYYLSTSASDLEWTHVWIAHQSVPLMHYSKDSITESFTDCGFKKKKKSVLMSGHNMFKAVILSSTELTQSCVLLEDRTFKGKPPWWCLTFSKGGKEKGKKKKGKGKRKEEGRKQVSKQASTGRRSRKLEWESPHDNIRKILDEVLQNNEANLYLGFVSSRPRISQDQTLGLQGWLNPVHFYRLKTAVLLRRIWTILCHSRKNTWGACLVCWMWQTCVVNLSITIWDRRASLMTN